MEFPPQFFSYPVEISLFFVLPPWNSMLFICQPYGISTLLSPTLWKFHNPQSKTPWNFRVLRFNTSLEIPLSSTGRYKKILEKPFRNLEIIIYFIFFFYIPDSLQFQSSSTDIYEECLYICSFQVTVFWYTRVIAQSNRYCAKLVKNIAMDSLRNITSRYLPAE